MIGDHAPLSSWPGRLLPLAVSQNCIECLAPVFLSYGMMMWQERSVFRDGRMRKQPRTLRLNGTTLRSSQGGYSPDGRGFTVSATTIGYNGM